MKSRALKLHLWQDIVFFILVGIVPVVVAGCEVFSSHSTPFKITFASVGAILLAIIVIRKFILNNYIKKLFDESVRLEHDYSINVGDETLCKRKWSICNLIIYAYHALVILLSVVLAYLFITALTEQLIAFKGAATIILGSVLIALLFKFFCYLQMYRSTKKKEEVEDAEGETQSSKS